MKKEGGTLKEKKNENSRLEKFSGPFGSIMCVFMWLITYRKPSPHLRLTLRNTAHLSADLEWHQHTGIWAGTVCLLQVEIPPC